MCQMISILVDRDAKVYAVDGVHSHSAIATRCGVDEDKCLRYEFDLFTRTLKQDFDMDCAPFAAKQSHDAAAQRFFDAAAGDAERLIAYVRRGNFDEKWLLLLLTATAWKAYEKAVATALNAYDEAVAPTWKAYEKAVATALKAYDAAMATAQKAYDAARATAQKAYEEAVATALKAHNAAMATAQKAYDAARATAWTDLFSVPSNRIEAWRS